MTAAYSIPNSRAELLGDGFGYQRMRCPFPPAPVGTQQAIYVMRVESNNFGTITNTGLTWNAATYFGLKFDSNFPSSSQLGHADYDNFFGSASGDSTDPYDSFRMSYHATVNYFLGSLSGGSPTPRFYDGNGSNTLLGNSNLGDYPFAVYTTNHGVQTLIWRIYTHPTTNEVLYEAWLNRDSFNLSTFDIANDMAPDNPKALLPVALEGGIPYLRTGTINGDVFGTNWRPSDGVMGFPTHFMAAHPGQTFNMYIPYVGVQYSSFVT